MARQKDLSIETLRGLAILLMVAAYVVRVDITREAYTDLAASAMRFFNYCFTALRMPLFASISGFLLASSPVRAEKFGKFASGKARRLLAPFVCVSALQFVAFAFLPLSRGAYPMADLWKIVFWPHAQFWFLPAMFAIYMLTGTLDAFKVLGTFRAWALCLAGATALHVAIDLHSKFLGAHGALLLIPFFLLGFGFGRYPDRFLSGRMALVALGVFAAAFGIQPLIFAKNYALGFHLYRALGILIGFSGLYLLYRFRRPVPALARMGSHAFGIYLFYAIGAALARHVLHAYSVHNAIAVFVTTLAAALGFALLIERLFSLSDWTSRLFLGEKRPASGGKISLAAGLQPVSTRL